MVLRSATFRQPFLGCMVLAVNNCFGLWITSCRNLPFDGCNENQPSVAFMLTCSKQHINISNHPLIFISVVDSWNGGSKRKNGKSVWGSNGISKSCCLTQSALGLPFKPSPGFSSRSALSLFAPSAGLVGAFFTSGVAPLSQSSSGYPLSFD